MHFRSAGAAHHADNFAARCPADDGVVNEDDALALKQIVHGVELEADAEVADALFRFDKCTADVVVADEAEAERDAGLFSVAERGGNAGVGHGHDDIGSHAGLARELAAHLVARLLHPAAEDARVGARKIDMLENTTRLRNTARVLAAGDAVFRDHDQFAGKNVADEFGAEQIEGAGFGREDDGVGSAGIFDAAHGERAEAARIARGKDAVARHHHNRKRAFNLRKRVGDGVDERTCAGVRDELHDDFGVRGGLEVCAVAFEARAHVAQVHQVAIVRDGDEALGGVDANGLRVEQRGIAGGGITRVTDGHVAGKLGQHIVCEDLRNQAHAFDVGEAMAVGSGNAG